MSVERPTGGPATVNPRSTVHHRACHHAPRTHRLGCRRGSGATCYMLTVPVREAAVHQMWTPGEAWVTALAECPRICFPFRSSWAEARAQTAAECPGRARWSSDSDAFRRAVSRLQYCEQADVAWAVTAFRPRPQDAGTHSCGSTRSQSRSASRAHRRLAGRGGRRDGAFATGAVLLSRSSLLQRLQLHPSSGSIAGEWSGKGHHHPRRTLTGTACRG